MEYFPENLKVQPYLIDKYVAIGTVGPKGPGVDLHSCTTLGVQSCHDLLKLEPLAIFSAQSMQMKVWSCGIALFYLLFSMFPLYFSVYMSMSSSLYHYHLSLHLFGRL